MVKRDETLEEQEYKARAAALRLLARREHSRLELTLKLRQRKIESPLIDQVLDEFEAEDWLSDQRFAESYARQRIETGYGPLRIQAELQQRGIHHSPGTLMAVTDAQWAASATRLRARRFGLGQLDSDLKEKARQARFLGARGFAHQHIDHALSARVLPDDTGADSIE
ncbi:MAG TPA: regulatory protein RecX [Marinobacter sp.]|nr:regulatory protein RecX [Marinobacter sp.]